MLAEGIGLDGAGLLAGADALRWSEGLLPSAAASPEPQAAVVRSAATAPAPTAYLLQLATMFIAVPLVQRPERRRSRGRTIWLMDATAAAKVWPDFGEGGGELMTVSFRAAARPAAAPVHQLTL
jgi:hypothetical protein